MSAPSACRCVNAAACAELYEWEPLEWEDVRRILETNLSQELGTGGADHHTFWLSTADADGRRLVTGIGAFWLDGHYYFCGGPRSRKIRNIERDPRCALGVAVQGFDVAAEGQATRITDDARLHRLAALFAEHVRLSGDFCSLIDGFSEADYLCHSVAPNCAPAAWSMSPSKRELGYSRLSLVAVPKAHPGGSRIVARTRLSPRSWRIARRSCTSCVYPGQ